jgi:hypothetical protein
MANKFEGGEKQNDLIDEEMNEPEKKVKEKIEDFEKLETTEEKEAHINEVLGDKEHLIRSAQEIEIEAVGGESQVRDKAGAFSRIRIKFAGVLSSGERKKEIAYATIAKVAHKEVDKKLLGLERTMGKELLEKKAALAVHEQSATHDLKKLKELGIHSEKELLDIADKLTSERSVLNDEVESKKNDLESILGEYSLIAIERQGQLAECIEEYQGYHDHVATEKKSTAQKIGKFERGLASLKLSGMEADVYKDRIKKAIDDEKEKLAKLEACEKALKERLEVTRANKSEVDTYLERVNSIGKTPTEISKQKADNRKKEADKKAEKTKANSIAQAPNVVNNGSNEEAGEGGDMDTATEVEAQETILEKTADEWIRFFKQKFSDQYDLAKNGNINFEEALKPYLIDTATGRIKPEINRIEIATRVAKFLSEKTDKYRNSTKDAKNDVEKFIDIS